MKKEVFELISNFLDSRYGKSEISAVVEDGKLYLRDKTGGQVLVPDKFNFDSDIFIMLTAVDFYAKKLNSQDVHSV